MLQACVRYGTGILSTCEDVVPKLPKCPVPVLIFYRNYRSVRYPYKTLYRYRQYLYPCAQLSEVSGTGIDVVLNLPK